VLAGVLPGALSATDLQIEHVTIVSVEKLDRDIGTVQVGKRANLLLLRKDPMQTIDAYAEIAKVILNGRVLDRSELAANAANGGSGRARCGPHVVRAVIDAVAPIQWSQASCSEPNPDSKC
jgi:hypothetical protein